MRLLDDFCHASDVVTGVATDPATAGGTAGGGGPATLTAALTFNAGHRIFEGHFPGQPVVPGVCMMQLVRELVETYLLRGKARVTQADNLKFLTMIDPRESPTVRAEVKYEENGKVVARFFNETTTFFKMNAVVTAI